MSRFLKFMAYLALFVFSFLLFLYWSFPYEVLKDRLVGSLGGEYDISIEELSPYWFTGIDISGLILRAPGGGKSAELLNVKRITGRASFFSLLLGNPSVSFDVDIGKGEIVGVAQQSEDEYDIDVELDDVDLKHFKMLGAKTGLNLSSRINGNIDLKIDKRRPIRSEGRISLDLGDLKVSAAEIKLGEMVMPLPDIVLSKRSGSDLKLEMGKGTVTIKSFKLTGGDFELDIKGKIFLSNEVDNYRFNLKGSFKASEKLGEALPFLFIVEKQKKEDGSFPLSITGRLARPSIKIGTFTLPI